MKILIIEDYAPLFGAGHAVANRQPPGQQGGSAGRANASGDVKIREAHSLGGETVEVGRLDLFLAVAAEFAVAEIVGQDEDDVGLACPEPCRGVRRKCRAGDECQSGNNYSKRNSDC
jgi:hypothetical protein